MKIVSLFFSMLLCTGLTKAQNCSSDTESPIAICSNELAIGLVNSSYNLFAYQANDGSYDNCSTELIYSFSDDTEDHIRTFEEAGYYPLEIWVTDEAGNQTSCLTLVVVHDFQNECDDDQTPPVVICTATLTAELSTDGLFPLLAELLDEGSYDECSEGLQYSLSTDVEDSVRIFTQPGHYPVELWVTDNAGNQSACFAILLLTSSDITCPSEAPIELSEIENYGNQITLQWSALAQYEQYVVEGKIQGADRWHFRRKTNQSQLNIGSRIENGTVYEWRVRAYCGEQATPFSKIKTFTGGSDATTTENRSANNFDPEFMVFPSPAKAVLNIVNPSPIEQIQVFDRTGRQMNLSISKDKMTSAQINISHLESGYYILQLITANEIKTLKFVKE